MARMNRQAPERPLWAGGPQLRPAQEKSNHATGAKLRQNKTGAFRRRLNSFAVKIPAQELAFSTVTARRFCDQQEMSLHTATGRSLP